MLNKDNGPQKILIVGGGTAGWMAATLIATKWKHTEVCLVESKDIGIIGVGEGSTPHLKLFFDAIKVKESDWMPRCNATYKTGITFDKWSLIPGFESYFHPFAAQTDDVFTLPPFFKNIQLRMQGVDVDAHPDRYFLETYLAKHKLAPIADESFPFGIAYGYHFDSAQLGRYLATLADKLGVKRVFGEVEHVKTDEQSNIQSVLLKDGQTLKADFFIDCSGFKGLLIQGALGTQFKSYEDSLVNNAAVVMPTNMIEKIPVETRSTALSSGWAWQIPLRERFGNGYVFSDKYISSEQAETELREHLGLLDNDVNVRHLSMKVGRVNKHWNKNCLAVGLSQGFIEPLEATAIALSFNTVSQFIQCLEQGNGTNKYEDVFNKDINARFDGICDYIVCHYKMNQRLNNAYWRDCAANQHTSETLDKILYLWAKSKDFSSDLFKYNLWGAYQPKSWACMLAGYGVFPALSADGLSNTSLYENEMLGVDDFIRRCGLNFTKQTELLGRLG